MKSIKPGRGPSMMGGIGSVFAVIFGIVWMAAAAQMGAPVFFLLFGLVFIVAAIVQGYYNFHNATSENRYSAFDITEEGEEPDPLQERFGKQEQEMLAEKAVAAEGGFCPYCGAPVEKDHLFCRKCGKQIRKQEKKF